MLDDHVHFRTKDNLVFTTRGFYHPQNLVRAAALYRSNGKTLEKEIDEFGTGWLSKAHLEYVLNSSFGRAIFVPLDEITETYDPFGSAREIIKKITDPTAIMIINNLIEMGVPLKYIGFIGSLLAKVNRPLRDVDIVIKGVDNVRLVKKNFGDLLFKIGARNLPEEKYISTSVRRYELKYNLDYNDFEQMIFRRWPTICIPGHFFTKLRFTYKPEEVPETGDPGKIIEDRDFIGEVIDDFGTNFMPRTFMISTNEGNKRVLTYFWDFTYCVSIGDLVNVRASSCSDGKTLLLHDPKSQGIKFLEESKWK